MQRFYSLSIAVGLFGCAGSLFGQVPGIINYQGRVTSGGTNFDGTGQFEFALVDRVGTTNYWSNDGTPAGQPAAPLSLMVTKGLYSVLLGDTNVGNMTAPIAPSVFNNPDVRLRVWFNDGISGFQQLSPDQRLGAVGYALNAANVFHWLVSGASSQQASVNNGYVATNNVMPANITLPSSPNIGDTLRVSGAGRAGWKLVQNAGQSILMGSAVSGPPGVFWSGHDTNRSWRSVACSSDGTRLVAAAYSDQVYTSTDSGATWTPRDSSRSWYVVASSADGTKLVAAADAGQIYTSADSGVTWTPRDSNRAWRSVASSADGTKLVAVAYNDQIYTSIDSGATWIPRDSARSWWSVASSADGTKLVAAVVGSGQLYTSADSGATWTPHASSLNWHGVASSADGTKLAAAALGGFLYTSTDSGATWTPHDSGRQWWAVASSADGSRLVAVVTSGQVYTSTDSGATWTARDSSRAWQCVACSGDGTKLAAGVNSGQIYTSTPAFGPGSTSPGTSGYLLGGQATAIELQYIGNGQFMPLSFVGPIFGF